MKSEILARLVTDPAFVGIARKIAGGKDIYKDLLHETFLKLHSLDDLLIERLHSEKNLSRYATVVMYREFIDKDKELNKKFRHLEHPEQWVADPSERSLPITKHDADTCLQYFDSVDPARVAVSKRLEEMKHQDTKNNKYPYSTELIRAYLRYGSLNKLQEATNINRSTAGADIKKIVNAIKKAINESTNSP